MTGQKHSRYILGDETFRSKAAIRVRVGQFLHRSKRTDRLEGADFRLCLALLERHPRSKTKIGCGVAMIEVRDNLIYPGNRCLWLVRTDGSETDWSYLECLKASSHRDDVLWAMRSLVVDQVLHFKNVAYAGRSTVPCAVTGKPVLAEDCHVDHAPPVFVELAESFAERMGGFECIDIVDGRDGEIGCTFEDDVVERAWQTFHRRQAKLQIVTREANTGLLRRARANVEA